MIAGVQAPDREVFLSLKHGVEAKSYDEVCIPLIYLLYWFNFFKLHLVFNFMLGCRVVLIEVVADAWYYSDTIVIIYILRIYDSVRVYCVV